MKYNFNIFTANEKESGYSFDIPFTKAYTAGHVYTVKGDFILGKLLRTERVRGPRYGGKFDDGYIDELISFLKENKILSSKKDMIKYCEDAKEYLPGVYIFRVDSIYKINIVRLSADSSGYNFVINSYDRQSFTCALNK